MCRKVTLPAAESATIDALFTASEPQRPGSALGLDENSERKTATISWAATPLLPGRRWRRCLSDTTRTRIDPCRFARLDVLSPWLRTFEAECNRLEQRDRCGVG